MRKTKFTALLLCITLILSGCASMNNTTKGGLLGGGGGAALGALIGGIAGKGGIADICRCSSNENRTGTFISISVIIRKIHIVKCDH